MEAEKVKEIFMLCNSINEEEAKELDKEKWIANFKFDGERIIAMVVDNDVILINRRGKICNLHFSEVVEGLKEAKLGNCILDGEIISLDDDFNKLMQRAMTKTLSKIKIIEKTNPVKYMIFDILKNQDKDLRANPLKDRIEELKKLFENKTSDSFELAEYKSIEEMLPIAKEKDKEGLIVKYWFGCYESRRSDYWKKLKFFEEATITITKYTENPKGIRAEDDNGNAVQIAGEQSKEVKNLLDTIGQVEIYVQYLEKTADNRMRFPSYRGLVNEN